MMTLFLGLDGTGAPMAPQILGALGLSLLRISSAWIVAGCLGAAIGLVVGGSQSRAAHMMQVTTEALGGIPPLFVLLLASYTGATGLVVQTVLIWIVLLPEVARRSIDAVSDVYRQPFALFLARHQSVSPSQIRRWIVFPAILENLRTIATVIAFRVLVFDITLGFLGYGRVAATATFGELLRNNRFLFLLPQSGLEHVLPVLAVAVVCTVLCVQAVLWLVFHFTRPLIQGGLS